MSLINSSYFIGEKNIPNTSYDDVSSMLTNLINIHEKEYLVKMLGYELFKLFEAGLQVTPVSQRYTDILLGTEFRGWDGRLKQWTGLVSITTSMPSLSVSLSSSGDIFFTVGVGSAPVDGDDTYVNSALAGMNYRVTQRAYGPLEPLDADEANSAIADIRINPEGGFTWLNGIKFSDLDKYLIEVISTTLDVTGYDVVGEPESPIADYVYYWYLRKQVNQAAGIGQVQPKAENSVNTSSAHQQVKAWNDMVKKSRVLREFMLVNYTTYPEFQTYSSSRDLRRLLTTINPYF